MLFCWCLFGRDPPPSRAAPIRNQPGGYVGYLIEKAVAQLAHRRKACMRKSPTRRYVPINCKSSSHEDEEDSVATVRHRKVVDSDKDDANAQSHGHPALERFQFHAECHCKACAVTVAGKPDWVVNDHSKVPPRLKMQFGFAPPFS